MKIGRYNGMLGIESMANPNPATVNLGGGIYTRQQLRQMFRDGRSGFEEHLAGTPVAETVRYDPDRRRVVLALNNHCEMSLPIEFFQEVCDATPEELSDVTILPEGLAIEWPRLDQQFLVSGLLSELCSPGTIRPTRRRRGRSKERVGGE